MWIFTQAADWFDKARTDNNKFLDRTFQGWVDYATRHESDHGFWPAIRNGMIYAGTGTLYALNQFSGGVASGFVDTLRIGDGVRAGGWGYGQDALRLISVAGAAARPLNALVKVGRLGLANVVAIDPAPGAPICTWVAAAKALVMTGTRHFATVDSIAEVMGYNVPPAQLPPVFLGALVPAMRIMGASVRKAGALPGAVEDTLLALLKANPESVAPFSVTWSLEGNAANEFAMVTPGTAVGHTMVAYLNLFGELRILDRTGKIFGSLAELDRAAYPGIINATFYAQSDTAVLMDHVSIVPMLRNGAALAALITAGTTLLAAPDGTLVTDTSWLWQALALEVRSVPFRTEARRSLNLPVRVATTKGQVKTQTFCVPSVRSSDVASDATADDCTTLRTYVVQSGDTLFAIAQTAYGNADRWRGIAAVNAIGDPTALPVGTMLIIP